MVGLLSVLQQVKCPAEDLHDIIELLEEMPRCEIVFCFDTDEAGKKVHGNLLNIAVMLYTID